MNWGEHLLEPLIAAMEAMVAEYEEKGNKKMTTENTEKKAFWTIESKHSYSNYGKYDSYAKAEQAAREKAWEEGKEVFIMSQFAAAAAPVEVNSSAVTKL